MTEQTLQARKDFSRVGVSRLVIGVVSMIAQVLVMLLWNGVLRFTPLGELEVMNWILSLAPIYLLGIPAGLLLLRKVPAQPQSPQKLGFKNFWILMFICIPIMYGGNLIGTLLSALLSGGSAENPLMDFVMGNPLYSFLFAVVLAPVIEEYLFRKQLIDRLGKYGEKTAGVSEREDLSEKVSEVYEVIVECADEIEQEEIFNRLQEEGLKCRVLTL